MKVSVKEIEQKLQRVLESRGYSPEDVSFIIDMYLGGELSGHSTHGLADFASFASEDYSGLDEPEILKQTAALYMVDAKSNPGVIIGKKAADEAMKRADNEVVGVSLIKNMEIWRRPGGIAKYIAEKGYLAIVMNDAAGAAMSPPGGSDPTLGTNPIAYGIPLGDSPLVVDLATSKKAWGQVRLANKYKTDLPPDSFYDYGGNITIDPKKAHSVLPFGDYKGYALALLIEILCGSLLGKAMMITDSAKDKFGVTTPDRVGAIFVIDPRQTVGLEQFSKANSDLIVRIKSSSALSGKTIRIPGEQAGKLEAEAREKDEVDLPDTLWAEIKAIT
ncbi:Ldh family oxidoreductase [Candidatus Saccharibacteria bacterium]|jgi:L-2-hydroxycarboxylate dehydrogenase (NAD+)|nr:Ldh family oxidoreductase [Candidatus Saccharibacteria bacterium]